MRVSVMRGEPSGMVHPISGPGADPMSATVRWYDPAKGYGFLVPDDGSPDIYCGKAALAAVGLATLLPEATVASETVQSQRGPEVSRILTIDFSTAEPRTVSPVRPPAAGRIAARPGAAHAAATSGRRVRALVKWFETDKGYGFLEPEDGSADLFCHLNAVQASGRDTLPDGAIVNCEVTQGDRGPQVSSILSVEPPPAGPRLRSGGPADRSRSFDTRYPGPQTDGPGPADMELSVAVKFFDPARGFGFVVPDGDGPEVSVHSSTLFRSGMTDLEPGQRVFVQAESAPPGLQATRIEPL